MLYGSGFNQPFMRRHFELCTKFLLFDVKIRW